MNALSLTPIQAPMDMRVLANQRNDAVEVAGQQDDGAPAEWAAASRIWSRQSEALCLAIVGEPPKSVSDAIAVLSCLAELRDQHDGADYESRFAERDIAEMTDVALHNCIVAMASGALHSAGPDVRWSAAQVERWAPGTLHVQHAAAEAPCSHARWFTERHRMDA